MKLAPLTKAEKIGIAVGGVLGHFVLGFGFWPVTIGASVGYFVGRQIDPSPEVPDTQTKAGAK